MPEKSKVRVGIIGCGGMASAHLPGLGKFEDVELVGFCDVSAEKAEARVAEHPGTRAFGDPGELIRECGPDLVYILLPPFAHGAAERAAIAAGVPFFCEKPIGNDR